MASGEVEFVPTAIASSELSGYAASHIVGEVNDDVWCNDVGDLAPWAGLDFGVAIEPTEILFMPAFVAATESETNSQGGKFQVSASATFAAGNVDLFTTAAPGVVPYYPRYQHAPIAVTTSGSTYRYLRHAGRAGISFNLIGKLRAIGKAGTAANARPVSPTISPWGGHYLTGSQLVTMTGRTTSSSIYYTITTDGSDPPDPTNSDTLYTAPFTPTIPANGVVIIKAVAYDATCSTPLSRVSNRARFKNYGYKPGDPEYDIEAGELIEGAASTIVKVSGVYYRFADFTKAGNGTGGGSNDVMRTHGFWMSTSTDLLNWTESVQILENPSGTFTGVVRFRPFYVASTDKWVAWCHGYGNQANCCIAQADAIDGPWAWVTPLGYDPFSGSQCSDLDIFELGGTHYVVGANTDIMCRALASDGLTATGTIKTIVSGTSQEGIACFVRGGVVFLVYGTGTFYDNAVKIDPKYRTSTDPINTWSAEADCFATNPAGGSTYNGQPSNVFNEPSLTDAFIWISDRWSPTALADSTTVILPITFASSTAMEVREEASWDPASYFASDVTVPDAPILTGVGAFSVGITMDIEAGASDGGSEIIDYQVWHDRGAGYVLWRTILAANIGDSTYTTDTGTSVGELVHIKARARNEAGYSPFTDPVEVESAGPGGFIFARRRSSSSRTGTRTAIYN